MACPHSGSNPLAPTISFRSGPETWITECSVWVGGTPGLKGFSSGTGNRISRSQYPKSQSVKLASQMPSWTSLIPTAARPRRSGARRLPGPFENALAHVELSGIPGDQWKPFDEIRGGNSRRKYLAGHRLASHVPQDSHNRVEPLDGVSGEPQCLAPAPF